MIKLVISSGFFGINETKSSIKAQLEEWGANEVEFSEEGFITANMSESKYESFISNIKSSIENQLELLKSDYKNITKIEHDNSYFKFTVYCSSFNSEFSKNVVRDIYMIAVVFQIFDGTPQDEAYIKVEFKNYKTRKTYEIIEKHSVREGQYEI